MGLEEVYDRLQWVELERQLQTFYPQWDISLWQLIKMVIQGRGMEAIRQVFGQLQENLLMEWGNWKSLPSKHYLHYFCSCFRLHCNRKLGDRL